MRVAKLFDVVGYLKDLWGSLPDLPLGIDEGGFPPSDTAPPLGGKAPGYLRQPMFRACQVESQPEMFTSKGRFSANPLEAANYPLIERSKLFHCGPLNRSRVDPL